MPPLPMITIVPQLPPAVDGVGEYAWKLAQQLENTYAIPSNFLVGHPDWTGDDQTQAIAEAIQARSVAAVSDYLSQLPNHAVIFLHYVPHGYAQKACPFWLVQALEQWRKQHPEAYLLTMFHELYACDWQRPWSSDFYLSPVQRWLTARLAKVSDVCLTSSQIYSDRLTQLSQGKHQAIAVPVFSNIGEPASVRSLEQRQPWLIIFGQRHSKDLIYQKSLALLQVVCESLKIDTIFDIGPSCQSAPSTVGSTPIVQLGKLPVHQISQYLSQALAGFLTYDPRRLGKSGIFAAYCAHGVLPINHRATVPTDGLTAGVQYWVPSLNHPLGDRPNLQMISSQAHAWYQTHTLAQQAHLVFNHLPHPFQGSVANVLHSF